MSGLGIAPYGLQAFGLPADPPESIAPAKIGSSRKIDGKTKQYIIASDGGFESMGDTAQRVYVLSSLAAGDESPLIDDRLEQVTKQRITEALAPLLDPKDPDIVLQEIDVSDDGGTTTNTSISYKDLRAPAAPRKAPTT